MSVVDYVLTSCKAIELLCEFEIVRFCLLLSDVHCAVNIHCLASEPIETSSTNAAKWQNDMRDSLRITLV